MKLYFLFKDGRTGHQKFFLKGGIMKGPRGDDGVQRCGESMQKIGVTFWGKKGVIFLVKKKENPVYI